MLYLILIIQVVKYNKLNYIIYLNNSKDYNKTNIVLIPYIYKAPTKRLEEKLNTYLYVGERDILYSHYKYSWYEFDKLDKVIEYIEKETKELYSKNRCCKYLGEIMQLEYVLNILRGEDK